MGVSSKGEFIPSNPEKFVGHKIPYYRSSWELAVMRMCDAHPSVIKWASEPMRIPYLNPLTNSMSVYIPDFLIEYIDANKKTHVEMIEIKPDSQSYVHEAKSKRNQMALAVNAAKWKYAQQFCTNQGITFRVITESNLFPNKKKKK